VSWSNVFQFTDDVVQDEDSYQYAPSKGKEADSLNLEILNTVLGFRKVISIPIKTLKEIVLTFPAKNGANSKNGEAGERGDTGEHRGHGGDGWHAGGGYVGHDIEILISQVAAEDMDVHIFVEDKVVQYTLPMYSTINILVLGGFGGQGGKGGRGGSSSDEYEAYDDGSGGPGGNGGNGGRGGSITIYSDMPITTLAKIIKIDVTDGKAGQGGAGGNGSPSGNGGKLGQDGKSGVVSYQILSMIELAKMKAQLDLWGYLSNLSAPTKT
jgi:hypothetical protein